MLLWRICRPLRHFPRNHGIGPSYLFAWSFRSAGSSTPLRVAQKGGATASVPPTLAQKQERGTRTPTRSVPRSRGTRLFSLNDRLVDPGWQHQGFAGAEFFAHHRQAENAALEAVGEAGE